MGFLLCGLSGAGCVAAGAGGLENAAHYIWCVKDVQDTTGSVSIEIRTKVATNC